MDQTTPTVGAILKGTEGRDAIHFALACVQAKFNLSPGQRVGLENGMAAPAENGVGIVDPFLTCPVLAGQCFWLFLFPGTITSLRHAWTHPAFADDTGEAEKTRSKEVSEAMSWLKFYAHREINPYCNSPDEALEKLISDLKKGELHSYGTERWRNEDLDSELWQNLAVIGVKVNPEMLSFHCSC